MLYWILSVICIVTLHSCVASKYYYKEDNGNYDVYYGPYPRWGYKEFRPPKSYKLRYEDRGNRPGKCIRGEFKCDSPYPIAKTKFFECELDYQCPSFFKCCQNHCFQHKICQPIDLEANDDINEVPTDTSVKTTSEVVTTQSSDSTETSYSVSTQISTATESPSTLNGITSKEIVSTTATVTIEDHPSSTTFPYTTTSKPTQQSTSRITQTPTTKRKETTTSIRLTSTAFPSTKHVSKSTTIATNEDLQSTSIISTENSKTVDHHPPSSYTTISEPSTFQSSTTEIFETTTQTYLPLNISSTGAERTETPRKVSTRHTLKPTTVVKNENSLFTTETPTESSTMIDRITNGKETSTIAVIVDDHTVTSTFSSFTTSTVTESPTSIITKLSPSKTTEITIVPSSPTTTEETITRKEISTQYTLKPTTVRENEQTRSTFVTSTKFDRITGENGKDDGTTKKASSTVSSDQNGQEMTSDYILSTPETTTVVEPSNSFTRPHQDRSNPTTKFITQTTKLLDTSSKTYKPTLEPESIATTQKMSESTSRKKQTTLIIDVTSDDGYLVVSNYSEPQSTRNSESLLKPTTIVDVEATTKTLDTLPVTSKQTRTSNGPAVTSAVTIPDSTLPFNKSTSFTLDVTSNGLSSTSKTTPIQMTEQSAIATTTPHKVIHKSTPKIVTQLSEPITVDENLNFSADGDNPDDTLIQEKLTTTETIIVDDFTFNNESASKTVTELSELIMDDEDLNFSGDGDYLDDTLIQEKLTTTETIMIDDFTFNNESASKQEVPQSFLKSPYAREEAKGKELYDISSTIGPSEATRMSMQYVSHSTLSTLKSSTAVKVSSKLPYKHITIALDESTVTTPIYQNNDQELLSSTVTIPEELTTVTSKLDNSMNSAETSTKTADSASSERTSTTHDYFNPLEFKTAFPKTTTKVTQQPTSKSTNAKNNNITSINTSLSTRSTPRSTHVKDVESSKHDRTVTTFPISEYPYGNKVYMTDRLLGTFRKLPSVHEKAGDGGDNYNFNNFLGFLDKISEFLRKRNDTTVNEKSTSYKSGQGTTQSTTKDKLTLMKIVELVRNE